MLNFKKVLILLIAVVNLSILIVGYKIMFVKYEKYKIENKCINEHVKAGIPRKDIYRNNGICLHLQRK